MKVPAHRRPGVWYTVALRRDVPLGERQVLAVQGLADWATRKARSAAAFAFC